MLKLVLPRGIRNNNPGNIRLGGVIWLGQKTEGTTDNAFMEFITPLHGLRALMKLLLNYHYKHTLDTVDSIMNRYAPPYENDTRAYAAIVARHLKVATGQKIRLTKPTLIGFAEAVVVHENGKPHAGYPPYWYAEELYDEAADLVIQR